MALTSAKTPITLCGNVISQHTCGSNISHIGKASPINQLHVAITSATIVMFQLQTVVITSTTLAITTAIVHTGPSGFTNLTITSVSHEH